MKRFTQLSFSLFFVLFLFVSCKKETVTPVVTMYGKWNVNKYQEVVNGVIDYNYTGKPEDFVDFKADNTYLIYADSDSTSGTFEVNGTILTFDGTDLWDITTLSSTEAIIESEYLNYRIIFYLKR